LNESAGVIVTSGEIYKVLLEVKSTCDTLVQEHKQDTRLLNDHEERIRDIEAREDLSRRVAALETASAQRDVVLEDIKRRVWAIPGASVLISAAVLIFALVRAY